MIRLGLCSFLAMLHVPRLRLALFVLACNLGNFLRRLVLPLEMARWILTTLREKMVKISAWLTRHARQVILQMARFAIPRRAVRADPQPHPALVAGADTGVRSRLVSGFVAASSTTERPGCC